MDLIECKLGPVLCNDQMSLNIFCQLDEQNPTRPKREKLMKKLKETLETGEAEVQDISDFYEVELSPLSDHCGHPTAQVIKVYITLHILV